MDSVTVIVSGSAEAATSRAQDWYTPHRRSGMSVAEIFTSQGEDHFRALEAEVVAGALTGPEAVVSLGGGALTTPSTRCCARSSASACTARCCTRVPCFGN